MISSKMTRIAGAAILGTIVGTGPAYADIGLNSASPPAPAGSTRSIAVETLGIGGMRTVGGETYYEFVDSQFNLVHAIKPGVAAIPQMHVIYTLENMVFVSALTNGSLEVDNAPTAATLTAPAVFGTALTDADIVLVEGGAIGDTMARFTVGEGATAFLPAAVAKLTIGQIGLKATGAGDSTGSIKVSLRYTFAGGQTTTQIANLSNIVKTVKSLEEASVDTGVRNTVTLASDYKQFNGGAGMNATVGSLHINAETTDGTNILWGIGSTGLVQPLSLRAGNNIVRASPLTFSGDYSFVSNVTLDASPNCDTSNAESVVDKTGDTVTGWKTNLDVGTLINLRYLCIHVDGETVIPNTPPYTVTVNYEGLVGAAFGPQEKTFTLDSINRQGIDVYIPYLSTRADHNHRIVMRNRGSTSVQYSMTFQAERGTTPTAGDDATGTLAANTTTVLSLVRDDVVTLDGGTRTAAILNLESVAADVDVATVQFSREDGSTDTVMYTAGTSE